MARLSAVFSGQEDAKPCLRLAELRNILRPCLAKPASKLLKVQRNKHVAAVVDVDRWLSADITTPVALINTLKDSGAVFLQ